MNAVALGGVFVASLIGSVHCAAMCGGFGCLAAAQGRAAHLAYHGGRLIGYVLLGGLAGAFGAGLDGAGRWAGFEQVAAPLAGLVAVGWGIATLRGTTRTAPTERGGRIAAVLRRAAAWSPSLRGLTLGVVTALLPCGWLWLFVATAAGTGSAGWGALAMVCFWAGSVPLLALTSITGARTAGRIGTWRPRLAAALLVLVGSYTVAMHLRGALDAPSAHATTAHHE